MSVRKSNKKVKLNITYSWTFNEKEWGEGKEHWEELKSNPRVIMGDDPISSWYNMNDVCSPQLEEVKLEKHE